MLSEQAWVLLNRLEADGWQPKGDVEHLKSRLTRSRTHCLHHEKRDADPIDPVARLPLRNGAAICRLNWMGKTSAKGLRQSVEMRVNDCCDLYVAEQKYEDYVNLHAVAVQDAFKALLVR